ncbi:MAG: CerR family C-terminal domain-containing protein [Deltaproteobacteria bacterium]|nr:CerR family C-terminal domain-containing protein [Candidatus Zymogenaceae bacterium]
MKREEIKTDNGLDKEFETFGDAERKILVAAVEVFAQKGFDGARTDEIASRAGVNKAMIYYYFHSKEKLYTIIVETIFARVSFILGTHLSLVDMNAPEQGIHSFINNYIDFIYSHRIFVKVMLWDLARGGTIIARVVGRVLRDKTDQIRAIFEQATREGYLRPVDPKHLFVSIIGMVVFFFFAEPVVRVIWGEEPITPEHIAERKKEIGDLIIHGILPKQG